MDYLYEMLQSYLETALWSTTDGDDDHLDDNYSILDISPEAVEVSRKDCKWFLNQNDVGDYSAKSVGHDFWLTRNGHGAGFWDGDYDEPYDVTLTKASEEFGVVDMCVGDDGRIYI